MKNNIFHAEVKIGIYFSSTILLLMACALTAYASEASVHLTPSEKAWLTSHPKIILGTVPDWAPISMRNKSGDFSGIAGSYKYLIEEKLPITFELAPEVPWGTVLDNMRNKKIDAVMLLGETPARDQYFLFTNILVNIPYVIVTRTDAAPVKGVTSLAGKKVTVRSHFVSNEWLAANYPEIVLIPKESAEQSLEAVLTGEAYAYVGSLAEVGAAITKANLIDLKVAANASFVNHLRIGVRNDWPELVSILNKAIDDISPKEHEAAWNLWVQLTPPKEGIDKRIVFGLLGLFVLFSFAGYSIYIVRLRKSYAEKTEAESKYASLFSNMLEGLVFCKIITDANNKPVDFIFLDVNSAFERITGLNKEFIIGERITKAIPEIAVMHPEWFEIFGNVALTGASAAIEVDLKPLNLWLDISVYSPKKGYFVATFQDITNRKRGEAELTQLNHMLTILSECNHLLVKETDEDKLFHSICAIILDVGDYAMALVGEQPLNVAGAEIEPRVIAFRPPVVETFLTTEIIAFSPCNRAIMNNECIIINDISKYEKQNRWTEAAVKNGCNAMIALPLRFSGNADAIMSIYARNIGHFSDSEVKLLKEMAEDLSFGVRTIRDRKKKEAAEHLLRESELRFRSLAQTANDAIISIDDTGNVTFWNGEAVKMFGYAEKEMIGQNIIRIIPERYRALHRAGIDRVAKGGGHKIIGSTVALEALRKGGEEFPVEISVGTWKTGEKIYFTGIIRDITNRAKVENELKSSRKGLADAQALAHLGNWELDLLTGKGTWSDESYRIFGFEPGAFEPSFEAFDKLIHPDDREKVEGYLQQVLSGDLTRAEFDARIIRPDGEVRVINDKLEVIHGKDGKPVTISGVNFDITDRKLYERKLEIANQELKAALEQVKQAKVFLTRSEKLAAVGTLSAGVAHEILNPLNIISTICQVLLLDERRGRVHESLKEIMLQIQRAAKITNSLRMFAREKKMDITPVDIRKLFNHTVGLMEHDLNLDNIFIDRNFDDNAPFIMADSDQLAQVFMNLLTNARDVLQPRRHGIISVSTKTLEKGIEFTFCDNGHGMPPNVVERIFDPFYTTKDPGKGTGLGLSVVHNIIEDHGGTIMVKTREGEGTCFTIFLPKETSAQKSPETV